ncbi:MAG: OsmC family protein [Pseudomonadota bacterium]
MKATVRWEGEAKFRATAASGHDVLMDGPPDIGGVNAGPRPMETLLMGVGGCASVDVVYILKKARQDVTGCIAELTAERAPEPPQVFTKLHLHFVVTGRNLKENQVQRAVELSAGKYCSASIMLSRSGTEVTHSHEIREAS